MTQNLSKFSTLGLNDALTARLNELGINAPTPIQEQAIPIMFSGQDIMGLAQTGTGKTAAYLLPLIQMISQKDVEKGPRRPCVLILAPTRELAHQVSASIKDFSRGITLRYVTICGGERYNNQISALKKGVDIIVATPGRFEDLYARAVIDLSHIAHVILDEADQMIDLGFYPAMKRICGSVEHDHQTIFFSATMPKQMHELANQFLIDAATIQIESRNVTADTVQQRAILVSDAFKKEALGQLLQQAEEEQLLVFTATKRGADQLAQYLSAQNHSVDVLHGDMRQLIRTKVLKKFKSGQLRILVATDVAARGIDVLGLNWVINYDLPKMPEIYVHRIGRTGRARQSGKAISLCTPSQISLLRAINKHTGGIIEVVNANGEAVAADQWGGAEEKSVRRRKRPFGRQRLAAKGKQGQKSGKEKSSARPKFSKRRPPKNMQKKDAATSSVSDQEMVRATPRKKLRPHKAKKSARDTQRTRTERTESAAKNRPAITKNRKAGRRRPAAAHRP